MGVQRPHRTLRRPPSLLRSQFSFLPLYLILYFAFPGEVGIRLAMVALGALALIFSVSYMPQNRSRRLQKKPGLGGTTLTQRRQREVDADRDAYQAIHRHRDATTD